MFGLGIGELIVILVVALMFVGPDKLPKLARALGGGIRSLRRHTQDLQQTIERDASIGPSVRELKNALSGNPSSLLPEEEDDDKGWSESDDKPKNDPDDKPKNKPDDKPRNG